MTALPPDPDPENTPGLERGAGVRPGDTPPESGSTSGLSHRQPKPRKVAAAFYLALVVVAVLAVAGILAALTVAVLGL